MTIDYRGRRVTVMGLGHFGGGAAAVGWLARQGAVVTVTDLASEEELADALPLLADVPIAAWHLGGHGEEDFQGADLVVVSPAVRPAGPGLALARRSGARLVTEIELFIENCRGRILGVTGANGKSTTAAMAASILTAAGRRTFLGGNIGGSLLEQLPQIGPDDWVVLEISSFQLWHFTPNARMPHIAVVTGCTPNHLDWHGSFAAYVAAKQRILTGQTAGDFAVLNTFDPEVASWAPLVRGRQVELSSPDALPHLSLPGRHNRINAGCAAAAAAAAGCDGEAIRRGLEQFRGLPQRLEWFAVIEGRRFYNDATATTPESTAAALESLDVPVWLLVGGKSKGFDFGPLAATIVARAQGVAAFGMARNEIHREVTARASQFPCAVVETMRQALGWCWQRSRPGDAIVLSPACASTDQFRNFHERGQRFVELTDGLSNSLNR
jgi:UDP-N-acetylmuramoylalanine--D-glutamate ligase